MNHKILPLTLVLLIFAGCAARVPQTQTSPATQNQKEYSAEPAPSPESAQQTTQDTAEFTASGVALPLTKGIARITKVPFGIYVAPLKSPVNPEVHIGFHAGTDFEIFPDELNKDVPVFAICDGKILLKRLAPGYGGVLVQECKEDNQEITVSYGHVKLISITQKTGDTLTAGEKFALLADAYSTETDGKRKHLHLGIKKGLIIDLHGFVQNESELTDWIDFEKLL